MKLWMLNLYEDRYSVSVPVGLYHFTQNLVFDGGRNSVIHACSKNHGAPLCRHMTGPETDGLHVTT